MGINFLLDEARDILKEAGADVDPDSTRVRFDPAFIEEKIKTVPSEFSLHSRNPAHTVTMGGNRINLAVVGSPPNVSDLERGRRRGNFDDFCDLIRLAQTINVSALIGGYPVEPIDIPPDIRHLKALSAMAKLTDKPLFCYSLGRKRVQDSIEIARLARGVDEETLQREPLVHTIVNANSPLQYDKPMLAGVIELSGRNQPVVFTPFTLAGAMAPVTMAGALVQQNAEALAGIAFAQCVRAGAPVVYGGFTSNVDMRTGSPAFGTPEYTRAAQISGQLARRYGLPFRSSNVNASNCVDVQSAYESQMALWGAVMGGTNYLMHGAGWLEGGLTMGYEKFVIDLEHCGMLHHFLRGLSMTEESLGRQAFLEVPPGGNHLASAHTMAHFASANFQADLADTQSFEQWSEEGALTLEQRANTRWKQMLADYVQPEMDPSVDEELRDFISRRKAAQPDKWY